MVTEVEDRMQDTEESLYLPKGGPTGSLIHFLLIIFMMIFITLRVIPGNLEEEESVETLVF